MPFRHGKNTRVLIGSSDLSAYFRETSVSSSVETAETTTFGVSGDAKTYVTGLSDSTVSISGLFDDDTGAADDVISAALGSDTDVVFTIAQDGGLVVGRRCLLGQSIETKYDLSSPVADVVSTSLDLQSDGESVHGFVLAASDVISSTSTGTSVDGIASSSNGTLKSRHRFAIHPANSLSVGSSVFCTISLLQSIASSGSGFAVARMTRPRKSSTNFRSISSP